MNLDGYWNAYEVTLKRVREQKPDGLAQLKVILDAFSAPSVGEAFFISGAADDQLADALMDAGWDVCFIEGGYLWEAKAPGGEWIHYVEGDIYSGRYHVPRGK